MLTASYTIPGGPALPVHADTTPEGLEYHCQGCGRPVVLKRGRIRVPHFAHAAGGHCSASEGETEEHREAKLAIFRALLADPRASNVQMERNLEHCRPDVYFERDGVRVAVEVQRSDCTLETIERRTKRYAEQRVAVLWVFVKRRAKLHAWQNYIQTANYGRCYFWLEGQTVIPTHYDPNIGAVYESLPAPICGGFAVNARQQKDVRLPGGKQVMIPDSLWWTDIQRGGFWPTRERMIDQMAITRAVWRWQMYNVPAEKRVTFESWLANRA